MVIVNRNHKANQLSSWDTNSAHVQLFEKRFWAIEKDPASGIGVITLERN